MNCGYFEKDTELVDMLTEWIRANTPRTQMLNIPRYREVVLAKARLDRLLDEIGEGTSTLELRPLFGAATLQVELEDLEVGNISDFTEAVRAAKGYKAYRMLKDRLEQRRNIKDEMIRVNYFLSSGAQDFSSGRVVNQIHGLDHRCYIPRVLSELFDLDAAGGKLRQIS